MVALALALSLGHQFVLPNLYLGIHAYATWFGATLLAGSFAAPLEPVADAMSEHTRVAKIAAIVAGVVVVGALLVPAPVAVRTQLSMLPGAVVARYKPDLHSEVAESIPQDKSAFPLADPLPSATSAASGPALFGGFVGTMGPSDFPSPCIIGLRPSAFPMRPMTPLAKGNDGISRFSRMELVCMPGVLRARGVGLALAIVHVAVLPSERDNAVGTPDCSISRLNTLPTHPLPTLRRTLARAADAQLGAILGRYSFRCTELSSATPCRFIPTHCLKSR